VIAHAHDGHASAANGRHGGADVWIRLPVTHRPSSSVHHRSPPSAVPA
jgi:hypothetical protein